MFRAIGFLIILWGLNYFFSSAFPAFEDAAAAVLGALEVAAQVATAQMQNQRQ